MMKNIYIYEKTSPKLNDLINRASMGPEKTNIKAAPWDDINFRF